MRNPNNYGSVYKLSGNRRKPYAARITTGYNYKGYPLYKFIGYYAKKTEALLALADYNKNPYDIDQRKSTVSDIWEIFKQRRFDKISNSGHKIYNAAYKHLTPLWDVPICELKTYQLQELIDSLTVKWQSKSHVSTLLNQMFNIAVELDICDKNYAKFIRIGANSKSDIHKPFTDEEIKILFANAFVPFVDTILIMIYSGMRPGELITLKISDIDLDSKTMVGGLKTSAGKNRCIPINDKTFPFVRKLCQNNKTYLVENNGVKIGSTGYQKEFNNALKAVGIGNHLPHDCRHTFASLMDTAGANKLVIKKIMGHATQDITDGIYTHKSADELLKNINLI